VQGDCLLKGVSHIFVDEIHERDINSDFLLIILKRLLPFRPNLKVILMSATLNAAMFAGYFSGCPVVSIPGRAHPVTALFLEDAIEHSGYVLEEGSEFAKKPDQKGGGKGGGRDGGGGFGGRDHRALVKQQMALENLDKEGGEDSPLWWKRELPGYSMRTYESLTRVADEGINYELIAQLLEHICFNCGQGAVLVFLPGLAEITRLYEDISDEHASTLARDGNITIFPLHSSLTSADQKLVFERPPPGQRKVVIATNIAETSITIDDVVYVIDACRMKENRWDAAAGMSRCLHPKPYTLNPTPYTLNPRP
jgi:ATP-dependent RNA helicase DHX57